MDLVQSAAEATPWWNSADGSAAWMAAGTPLEALAPLVPLFAPYCGGLVRQTSLEEALTILLAGEWAGRKLLQGGRSHALQLRWSGETAPQVVLHCDLTFPALPQVVYAFDLPCHQLVQWLMERQGDELPETFWHWLLLGRTPLATESVGGAA